jgi:transposase-like protein
MARSIHTTFKKNIKGLTKAEIIEQYNDPNSEIAELAKKSGIKKQVKKTRRQDKENKNGL